MRDALLTTVTEHRCIVVRGAGTGDLWAEPPGMGDATLETTGLNGVLQYNPADMTIAVRAGTRLDALQAELDEHGQRLAFDPARAEHGATLAGLLATADGGPSRHAYGTLRDLVIGVTVVLADGTVARSGGHVIKNVAGYDLAKLFYGSFGTLGALAEIVLRLHPAPRSTTTVTVECTRADAFDTAQLIAAAGLEPSAVELLASDDTDTRLLVRFEGTPSGVLERVAAVPTLTSQPTHTLDEDEAARSWAHVSAVATGEPGDTVLRFGALPSTAATTTARAAHNAADLGLELAVTASISSGMHTLRLRGGDTHTHQQLLHEVQRTTGPACTVLRRDGLGPDAALWGPAPSAVALMREVKKRFDPDNRFGTHRLGTWLEPSPTNKELTA